MARDARMVIRARQRQKQMDKRTAGAAKIVDARQIIKMKMKKKANVANRPAQNFVRRQFNAAFSQPKGIQTRQFQRQSIRRQLGSDDSKKVVVGRSGILKVMARPKETSSYNANLSTREKSILADRSGITITMRNKPSTSRMTFDDRMEEDDELEKMTLRDFPEMKGLKLPSQQLFSSSSSSRICAPPSTSQSLFSRLSGGAQNTMVADTITYPAVKNTQASWRVHVTNLDPTVSEGDVFDLFSSIGSMKGAGLVRPGFAIVEYFSKRDALLACETYHNRLLDGQPMQCTIEAESQSARPSIAMRLGEKASVAAVSHYPRQTASSIFSAADKRTTLTSRGVEFTVKVP